MRSKKSALSKRLSKHTSHPPKHQAHPPLAHAHKVTHKREEQVASSPVSPWKRLLRKVVHVLLVITTVGMTLPQPLHDLYASGMPSVALGFTGSQSSQPLIGENFSFTATFQNSSPVDPGFGPYVDLVFRLMERMETTARVLRMELIF